MKPGHVKVVVVVVAATAVEDADVREDEAVTGVVMVVAADTTSRNRFSGSVQGRCDFCLGVIKSAYKNWKAHSEAFSSSSLLPSFGTTGSTPFGGSRKDVGH